MIDKLNSIIKIKIAPSKIHGVGVFAIMNIPKGTKLYANVFPQSYKLPYDDFSKLLPEIKELIISRWPRVVNSEPFMWPDVYFQGYMNHYDIPNYDAVNDITLRDIDNREEITENYKEITGWEKAFPWLE